MIDFYKKFEEEGVLFVCFYVMVCGEINVMMVVKFVEYCVVVDGNDFFMVCLIKWQIDGVFGVYGVWFFDFYEDLFLSIGFVFELVEDIEEIVCIVIENGYQVNMYVIGDCVNCEVFDIYECIFMKFEDLDFCWCIEYVQYMYLSEVLCFVLFGVIVLMQGIYCIFDVLWVYVCFGEE